MASTPATAPRYLTRFRCTADACEDTCCSGLAVPVSRERWRALREAVAGGPEAGRVEAFVTAHPEGGSESEAALIAKREDGYCAFLDERKLCSLHGRYGEAVLPDICASFPRASTRWGERLEVVGSLACPEMVRLCLLAEDSLEWVPVEPALAVRPEVARRVVGTDSEEGWSAQAEVVRDAAVRLMQRRELPFASRLFALGRLALRLDAFYFQGTEYFRGETRAQAERLLAGALEDFARSETLEALHQDYSGVALPGGPWAAICSTALKARVGQVRSTRFHRLVQAVQASHGGADAAPDAAWEGYARRNAVLEARFGARLEQYFRHHAVNHWLRHPFTDAARVSEYVFRLTLRSAVLRWLLLGHPEVVALCEGGVGDASLPRLDAAAVECVQLSAKHLEQSPELVSLARGLAGEGGSELLGRMLVLLKGL